MREDMVTGWWLQRDVRAPAALLLPLHGRRAPEDGADGPAAARQDHHRHRLHRMGGGQEPATQIAVHLLLRRSRAGRQRQPAAHDGQRQVQGACSGARLPGFGAPSRACATATCWSMSAARAASRASFRNTTVNGQVTGKGLDFGFIDDPIKGRKEANSMTVRDATWNWLTDDFFTRFSDHAALLMTLTRWHLDDPAGRFLEQVPRDGGARLPGHRHRGREAPQEGRGAVPRVQEPGVPRGAPPRPQPSLVGQPLPAEPDHRGRRHVPHREVRAGATRCPKRRGQGGALLGQGGHRDGRRIHGGRQDAQAAATAASSSPTCAASSLAHWSASA